MWRITLLIFALTLAGSCARPLSSPSDKATGEPRIISPKDVDLVEGGIQPCWAFDTTLPNAWNLAVKLRVIVDESGHFTSAEVLDRTRYQADEAFRRAADAARRAVMNPRCNKIPLPPERLAPLRPSFILNFAPIETQH
jgi:hypothetical protein